MPVWLSRHKLQEISMPPLANLLYQNRLPKTKRYYPEAMDKSRYAVHLPNAWLFLNQTTDDRSCVDNFGTNRHLLYAGDNGRDHNYRPACSRFYCPFPNAPRTHLPAP